MLKPFYNKKKNIDDRLVPAVTVADAGKVLGVTEEGKIGLVEGGTVSIVVVEVTEEEALSIVQGNTVSKELDMDPTTMIIILSIPLQQMFCYRSVVTNSLIKYWSVAEADLAMECSYHTTDNTIHISTRSVV